MINRQFAEASVAAAAAAAASLLIYMFLLRYSSVEDAADEEQFVHTQEML